MRLNGIVARMMKVGRFLIIGFTEDTITTTSSTLTPIAPAYIGSVMKALQKHIHAVRMKTLAIRKMAMLLMDLSMKISLSSPRKPLREWALLTGWYHL